MLSTFQVPFSRSAATLTVLLPFGPLRSKSRRAMPRRLFKPDNRILPLTESGNTVSGLPIALITARSAATCRRISLKVADSASLGGAGGAAGAAGSAGGGGGGGPINSTVPLRSAVGAGGGGAGGAGAAGGAGGCGGTLMRDISLIQARVLAL